MLSMMSPALRRPLLLCAARSLKMAKPNVAMPTSLDRLKYRVGLEKLRHPTIELNNAGQNMFAICAEYPPLQEFIEELALPDTFQTWFSVTTLHMWLCLVRLRKEGVEGQLVKKNFVQVSPLPFTLSVPSAYN